MSPPERTGEAEPSAVLATTSNQGTENTTLSPLIHPAVIESYRIIISTATYPQGRDWRHVRGRICRRNFGDANRERGAMATEPDLTTCAASVAFALTHTASYLSITRAMHAPGFLDE